MGSIDIIKPLSTVLAVPLTNLSIINKVFLETPRIERGAAELGASMLPMSYSAPTSHSNLIIHKAIGQA